MIHRKISGHFPPSACPFCNRSIERWEEEDLAQCSKGGGSVSTFGHFDVVDGRCRTTTRAVCASLIVTVQCICRGKKEEDKTSFEKVTTYKKFLAAI